MLDGAARAFHLYGPTRDSTDMLPGLVDLPDDVRAGDYIEFTEPGAYSLTGRTRFNGHYSDTIVSIRAGTPAAASRYACGMACIRAGIPMVEISWQDFEKVELCVGTIVSAEPFPEARRPASRRRTARGSPEGIREPGHG